MWIYIFISTCKYNIKQLNLQIDDKWHKKNARKRIHTQSEREGDEERMRDTESSMHIKIIVYAEIFIQYVSDDGL